MRALGTQYSKEFSLKDLDTMDFYISLIQYFKGDKLFIKDKNTILEKGLFIRGTVGFGKSIGMKIFSNDFYKNRQRHFQFYTLQTLVIEYLTNGLIGLETILRKKFAICIDEIGVETIPLSYFGNNINIVQYIIERRYLEYQNNRKAITHFTTNLTPKQIEQFYGERSRDRLKEMCNDIVVTGNSKRR